ncbi:MAG TPA: DUF6055 domain-containing protein [Polyangiaceae bacterium]
MTRRCCVLLSALAFGCSDLPANEPGGSASGSGGTSSGGLSAKGGTAGQTSEGGTAGTSSCAGASCMPAAGASAGGSTTAGTPNAGGSANTSGSSASGGMNAGAAGTNTAGGGAAAGDANSGGSGAVAGASGSAGESGASGSGGCDAGSTTTAWASECQTEKSATCVSGTWSSWGSSSPENYPLKYETEHFAFLWPDDRNVALADVQSAGEYMESVLWPRYIGSPIFWPEPYCETANKLKTSIHIIADGLYGGCNDGRPGIWVGPGAMRDHWGLGHEWMHSLQCMQPGFADCGSGGCWIFESHANFMPHQLDEYRDEVHCSEMLVNEPHLYYGSTRDRYCNWQFFEFLKDKYCYRAVNEMWTANAPSGQRDPWNKLALNMGWDTEELNDVFADWAMHNVTWDYKNPPPTSGDDQGTVYRRAYGSITSTTVNNNTMRRHRLTRLEPLDPEYAQNRRFFSPYFWAPQRFGYNVVRLYPEAGASTVSVKFRGVTQDGANSGWRWGLVATEGGFDDTTGPTRPRYSRIQRGSDGDLSFCVNEGEALFLVVMATPTVITKIVWDQAYPSIHRYPYLVELGGAWPQGFSGGEPDACPSGTERHENGGGCAPASLAASVYVGPYAQVLGGTVSGSARIEDQATILNGATVSGGTVGALSVLNRFTVSGTATVQSSFYPPGFFESGQGLSGTARLYGDVEYRGQGLNKSSGSFYGFVDSGTMSATIQDVTVAPPYTWRP